MKKAILFALLSLTIITSGFVVYDYYAPITDDPAIEADEHAGPFRRLFKRLKLKKNRN